MAAGQVSSDPVVPPIVRFTGVVYADGKPASGPVEVTFSLYSAQQGGAALWMESQRVQADGLGNYAAELGSTAQKGLPATLFAAGEARWLGVRVEGQSEQPRVMLLAVPYALKAGDAETLGGLPASAFLLAPLAGGSVTEEPTPAVTTLNTPAGTVTGSGTANVVPLWTSASNIGNSVLSQSGMGTTAKIGINTTTPGSTLDVKGSATVRGTFSLPTTGTATSTAGKTSQPFRFAASVFNSGTSTPVAETFQWQAEPVGNNTGSASGSLNLLFGQGTSKPSETGLRLGSNGLITFAPGQTFPGTGSVTGVIAGTALTGGGTSGNLTLNVDTAKVPLLAASNTFTGDQTVNGSVSASSVQSGAGTFTANGSVTVTVTQNSVNGDGIDVNSAGYGILARTGYVGLYGQSSSGYGVWGTTDGSTVAGVYGDAGAGFGVLAESVQSQALWAESRGTGSSNGAGPDGVHGVSHASAGSGVAGINDAANGIAVPLVCRIA
jgi:hypothetical protein